MFTLETHLDFKEIRTARAFEDICDQIRSQLASGALRPGDKLPNERDLATGFGVGRPAVREALRTLEISGIVRLQKGAKGGAFICEGQTQIMTETLRDFLLLGRISLDNLKEARLHIGTLVMRLACERGAAEDFDAIEQHIALIDSLRDLKLRAAAALELFRMIAAASHNEIFVVLMEALGKIIFHVVEDVGRTYFPELPAVRLAMLHALRNRDEQAAARAMEAYLTVVHGPLDISATDAKAGLVSIHP